MPLSRTLADLDRLTRARVPEAAIADLLGMTRRSLEYVRRRHGMRVADVLRRMVAEQVAHAETAALGECAAVPVGNVSSDSNSSFPIDPVSQRNNRIGSIPVAGKSVPNLGNACA